MLDSQQLIMLLMQQLINAATATFDSIQIQFIPGPGLNLGPPTQKADTLPLCYPDLWYILIMQLYLKQIAFKAALNKRLFSAALNYNMFSYN